MEQRQPAVSYTSGASYVVAGSLERLDKYWSIQRRFDVLHSTLYAQALADSKHNRSDAELWYKVYVETLRSLGWQLEMFDLQQHTPSGIFYKFSSMLEKCGDFKDLLWKFRSLKVSNKKVQMLHNRSISGNTINFQLLQFKQEDECEIRVTFAACYAQMTRGWMGRITHLNSTLTSFLFANMPTLLVRLFCGVQEGTFDHVKYGQHRERILKELTDSQLTKCISVI